MGMRDGSGPAAEGLKTAPLLLQRGSHEVCSPHFAVVIEYKGQEQTTELRLPQDIIATLALEAEFRDMRIGELMGALIVATMEKDLLQLILDTEKGYKPANGEFKEIRISPMLARRTPPRTRTCARPRARVRLRPF
jgi:hypothetical protein